jgi:hypothetical protein
VLRLLFTGFAATVSPFFTGGWRPTAELADLTTAPPPLGVRWGAGWSKAAASSAAFILATAAARAGLTAVSGGAPVAAFAVVGCVWLCSSQAVISAVGAVICSGGLPAATMLKTPFYRYNQNDLRCGYSIYSISNGKILMFLRSAQLCSDKYCPAMVMLHK